MKILKTAVIVWTVVLWAASGSWGSEIHEAVKEGELGKVMELLKAEPKLLNAKDKEGMTPLNRAALEGDVEIASKLIEMGADIRIGDADNSRPIHNAAISGITDMVDLLLAKGACVNEPDDNGVTPLIFAASRKKNGMAEYLIELGADINAKSKQGWTPIQHAVVNGGKYLVGLLIEKGVDVNQPMNDGVTPLHSAASFGWKKITLMLLDAGADVNARNDRGETPLSYARNPNCISVVKILVDNGADVKSRSDRGETPLHGAAERGSVKVAQFLIENGADVNAMDDNGWTPLTWAGRTTPKMVEFLVSKGAEVNPHKCAKKGIVPRSPLYFAAAHGSEEAAILLVKHGADVNAKNDQGETPLHAAVFAGRKDLAKFLAAHGADVNAKEKNYKRTPLHAAAIKGYKGMVDMLLAAGADPAVQDTGGNTALDCAVYHNFCGVIDLLAGGKPVESKWKKKCPTLCQKLGDGESIVWYLGHSGWAIKTKNHLLIFDYWKREDRIVPDGVSIASGYIHPKEIADQNVTVFVSHGHRDHYDQRIFEWRQKVPRIEYVLGFKATDTNEKYLYMPPRTEKTFNGMKVSTIESTDTGVAFLVQVDGVCLYHSGDHAMGHNEKRDDYLKEIDYLADMGIPMDLGFFPITGCGLGDPDSVREGVQYAMKKLKPRLLFPMHAGDRTHRLKEFAEHFDKKKTPSKIVCAIDEGDRFMYGQKKEKKKLITDL